MKIIIETIPHNNQRYETVGDYWIDDNSDLQIRVSFMNDWRKEMAVAIHEFAEFFTCKHNNITEEVITKFDLRFEDRRKHGLVPENAEPGFDHYCPYYSLHYFATCIEMLFAREIGLDWGDYEHYINNLTKKTKKTKENKT
jgi:hypothetical protein